MFDFMDKKLYPLKFIPIASRRPWGGNTLVTGLGKEFVVCDEDGNETVLGADEQILWRATRRFMMALLCREAKLLM